jgi:ADP-heptose:LPS heptosyltransferase
LDVLVCGPADELLVHHDGLDEILVFGEDGDLGLSAANRMSNRVRDRHYEMVLDFSGTRNSGLVTWRSKAPERFGFASVRVGVGVRQAYSHTFKLGEEARNRSYQNLLLCGEICGHTQPKDMTLGVPEEEERMTEALFHERFEGDKRVVGLGFGPDVSASQVCFLHDLSERIAADGRFDLMLIPLPDAWNIAQEVAVRFSRGNPLPPRVRRYCEVVALIQECDIAISTDISILHMSYILGIKNLALFLGRRDESRLPMKMTGSTDYSEPYEEVIDAIEAKLVSQFYPVFA